MDNTMAPVLRDITSEPKGHEDRTPGGLPHTSGIPTPAMTYDDIFPGLPETSISNRSEGTIGKWNNKLRVGPRNVTQVCI